MDGVRIGRILRALRMRRGWRQLDLAERVGVSQSLIARVERGGAGRLRLDSLERIAKALEARLSVRLDWHGEAADRLLDAGHAELVEFLLGLLREAGWEGIPEVTFSVGPERGSFDILAWHEPTGTLLIVEVKTVVPDMQAMLATFDRKQRHANGVARGRGWRPARIWSLLAIGESARLADEWRPTPQPLPRGSPTGLSLPNGACELRRPSPPALRPCERCGS